MLFWNKPFRPVHAHSIPVSMYVLSLSQCYMLNIHHWVLSPLSIMMQSIFLSQHTCFLYACVSTSHPGLRCEIKEQPPSHPSTRSHICMFGIWSEGSDFTRMLAILHGRAGDSMSEALQRGRPSISVCILLVNDTRPRIKSMRRWVTTKARHLWGYIL